MRPSQVVRVSPPTDEPVSLADAKAHLRMTHDAQDALIEGLIRDARARVEGMTQRPLITQTLQMDYSRFSDTLHLGRAPIQDVVSVSYLDLAGERQTLATTEYQLLLGATDPTLIPISAWPNHLQRHESVQVTVTAGYGDDPEDVPGDLRRAILLLIGHWHENAELSAPVLMREVPRTFDWIINDYRYYRF